MDNQNEFKSSESDFSDSDNLREDNNVADEIFNGHTAKPRRYGLVIALIIVILVVAGGYWLSNRSHQIDTPESGIAGPSVVTPDDSESVATDNMSGDIILDSGSDFINVTNQMPGLEVVVSSVTLPVDGWVAVRENNDGQLGNILGALWLPAGTHTDSSIDLLRATESSRDYFITLYADNGDKSFNYQIDKSLVNEQGEIINTSFSTESEA